MSLCDVLANCPGYVMSSHVDSWDSLVTLQRSNRSIMEGGMDAILRFLIIKILTWPRRKVWYFYFIFNRVALIGILLADWQKKWTKSLKFSRFSSTAFKIKCFSTGMRYLQKISASAIAVGSLHSVTQFKKNSSSNLNNGGRG